VFVSTVLRTKGYEEFLPMHRVTRQWSDRRKEIETPLFTGYVFCRLNSGIRWPIVTTPGVIRIIGTSKEVAVIDDREIEAIQLVSKAGVKMERCAYAKLGDRVRITDGSLSGVEGIVTGYKNQQRLILSVNLIQSSVSVEVDGYNLMAVTEPSPSAPKNHLPVPYSRVLHIENPTPLVG
jgi:transcription antitermination factor NusG